MAGRIQRRSAFRVRVAGMRAGPFITCRWKRISSTPPFTRIANDDVAITSDRMPHGAALVDIEVRDDVCSSVPSAIGIGTQIEERDAALFLQIGQRTRVAGSQGSLMP
jgi:hypothetical protein